MTQPLRIRELSSDEQNQVLAAMSAFCGMVEELGIEPEAEELDTPDLADMLIANWRRQPRAERYSAETMATIVGAAVGDYLKHHFRLEWRVATDEFGTSVVLYNGNGPADPRAFTAPLFDTIEKRLSAADDDFVVDLLEEMWEDLQPFAREPRTGR